MTDSDRIEALRRFYSVLDRLSARGLHAYFGDVRALSDWPLSGVYFIFEPGEQRVDTGIGPRVVRVGTHALKTGSKSTLRGRILQHRGPHSSTGGHHRASIFRLLVGSALSRRDSMACPTWGRRATATADVTTRERDLEAAVSRAIAPMEFVLLPIEDEPGPDSLRGFVERNSIALLSNYGRRAIDRPSIGWLGTLCPRPRVQGSGLWNNNHVEEESDLSFVGVLERLAEMAIHGPVSPPRSTKGQVQTTTRTSSRLIASTEVGIAETAYAHIEDLSGTLMIIPCSGRKAQSTATPDCCGSSILNGLSSHLSERLMRARQSIACDVQLDESTLLPAWRRYAGGLYVAAAPALFEAIEAGRLPHLLILSGGYGVVRADELIGDYNARLVLSQWPRGLLEDVIGDYARRHALRRARLLAGSTTDYARAFRQVPWRDYEVSDAVLYSPESSSGALIKVPRALGEALRSLLRGGSLSDWRSSDGLGLRLERLA